MKTLQEQYNKIQEGKGSKEVFMKNAKRQFPNLVRNAAGFSETANTLKGKGIISEAVFVSTGSTQKPDWFSIFNDSMSSLTEEAKAVEKKVSKEVEDAQEGKGFDYKDLKNVDNVFGESFLRGYYTEIKDPANKDKTIDEVKDIVAKNLAKDRLYYTTEAQFGVKGIGYTDEAPSLKASKSDQMEKVKIKEDLIKEHIMIKLTDILAEASDKPKAKKAKKETTESKLKAIEEQGRVTTLEAQIDALEEIIEAKTSRINMVQEDENMAELVAPAKVKEMQREVKKLTKLKEKFGRTYEKMCGKSYGGKTVLDEESIEEETIDEDFLDEASNDNSNLNSDQGSNSNSNTNPESYSGLDRFKRK